MADDGPRCELLYPENTYTHEGGAHYRGGRHREGDDTRIEIKFTTRVWGGWGRREGRGEGGGGINRVCARYTPPHRRHRNCWSRGACKFSGRIASMDPYRCTRTEEDIVSPAFEWGVLRKNGEGSERCWDREYSLGRERGKSGESGVKWVNKNVGRRGDMWWCVCVRKCEWEKKKERVSGQVDKWLRKRVSERMRKERGNE